jgi:hypothetical protein
MTQALYAHMNNKIKKKNYGPQNGNNSMYSLFRNVTWTNTITNAEVNFCSLCM